MQHSPIYPKPEPDQRAARTVDVLIISISIIGIIVALTFILGCRDGKIVIPPCVLDGSCLPTATAPGADPTPTSQPTFNPTAVPATTATVIPQTTPTSAPAAGPTSNPSDATPIPGFPPPEIAYFGNGPKGGRIFVCGPSGNSLCSMRFPDGIVRPAVLYDSTLKFEPLETPCDRDHDVTNRASWYWKICGGRDYDNADGPSGWSAHAEWTNTKGQKKSIPLQIFGSGYERWVEYPGRGRTVVVVTTVPQPFITKDGVRMRVAGSGQHVSRTVMP